MNCFFFDLVQIEIVANMYLFYKEMFEDDKTCENKRIVRLLSKINQIKYINNIQYIR